MNSLPQTVQDNLLKINTEPRCGELQSCHKNVPVM